MIRKKINEKLLIIDDLIPKLIEIIFALCMLISNELDKIIKTYLFVDTLNLIGIIPYYRKTEEPLNSRYKFKNETDEYINMALNSKFNTKFNSFEKWRCALINTELFDK